MTETEKLILEKLDDLNGKVTSVQQELASTKQTVESVQQELASAKQTVESVQQELASTKQTVTSVQKELTSTKQTLTSVQLTLENETNRKIDVIGEGHDFLKQRLDEALQFEKKRESIELELINLRMEVKKIKEHLSIA